jgi:hypothetical protein
LSTAETREVLGNSPLESSHGGPYAGARAPPPYVPPGTINKTASSPRITLPSLSFASRSSIKTRPSFLKFSCQRAFCSPKAHRAPHSPRLERQSPLLEIPPLHLETHSPPPQPVPSRESGMKSRRCPIPHPSRSLKPTEPGIPRGERRPGSREQAAKASSIMHIQGTVLFPLGNVPRALGNASFPFAPTHSPEDI